MTAAPIHGPPIGSAAPPEGCAGSLSRIAVSRTDNEPPDPAAIRRLLQVRNIRRTMGGASGVMALLLP